MQSSVKVQEGSIRRKARRLGYSVRKSREWKHVPHANNLGGYMLIENDTGCAVLGYQYEATLGDIEAYLKE
jgi:molybdenum-dependent DNA-binding transcriptional regulator ModE